MKFRTEVNVKPFPFNLTHQDSILMMGSCFTQNIGEKLRFYGFDIVENPYGITYNPMSLFRQLEELMDGKEYTDADLVSHQGHFLSLQHHSGFNNEDKTEVLNKINSQIRGAQKQLKRAKVLFISLGSAWVWLEKSSKSIVNNCHKIPTDKFEKKLLAFEELYQKLCDVIKRLKGFNADLEIVFTLSPIRHWRHGAQENMRSKSLMHSVIHELADHFNNVTYFPSYEIMIDDLRDYRFYSDDMLHPSVIAVGYIWQKFEYAFFKDHTLAVNKEAAKIRGMQGHKFRTDNPVEQIKFQKKLEDRLASFKSKNGFDLPSR